MFDWHKSPSGASQAYSTPQHATSYPFFLLPSILLAHVETSENALSKEVEFSFLVLWNTMRVRQTFNR
jgi:hypothetical protein